MKKAIVIIFFMVCAAGCKKLVEVDSPQNQLTTDKVFSDTTSARAALGTIYGELDKYVDVNYSVLSDLYADNLDFTNSAPQTLEFYRSTVSPANSSDLAVWQYFYQIIYECNDLIQQLPVSGKIPASSVTQFSSEAKFLRAFAYFNLINTYGNVPLLLTTDVTSNAGASRTEITLIYQQIIKDLTDAKKGLTPSYPGGGRVRANYWAASALLARVYLFQNNWVAAENESSGVINSGLYSLTAFPADVFSASDNETILQVWNQYGYVSSAVQLVPAIGSLPLYTVSSSLISSFENGDLRKSNWIGISMVPNGSDSTIFYFYNKYQNTQLNTTDPEFLTVLRLAEQYLIRAEARAEQGKITGNGSSSEDLNIIRARAGLSESTASTQAEMLTAINRENRVEFFGEWANRFLNLKRTGQLNPVMESAKTTWVPDAALWQVPLNELTYDHSLTQNPGY